MKYLALLIFLLTTSLLSTGCTIIGGYSGYNLETKKIYYREFELEKSDFARSGYSNIKNGDDLKIILITGESLTGNFLEFKKLSMSEYSKKYAKMREVYGSSVFFPDFHDTIKVIYNNKKIEYYEFIGFDYACIQVRDFYNKTYNIPVINNYKLTLSGHDYASLFKKYAEMMNKGEIPTLSKIVILNNDTVTQIPFEEINQIIKIVPYRKNYALEGTAIGLGIDILIVIFLATNVNWKWMFSR